MALTPRVIDIKGSDNHHYGVCIQISLGLRDVLTDELWNKVNILLICCWNWDYWWGLRVCSLYEILYLLKVLHGFGFVFFEEVDFVLKDNYIVHLHDLYCSKMFLGLWLRTRVISVYQQNTCVHDGRPAQHRWHQRVMSRAINERDMSDQPQWSLADFAFCVIGLGASIWSVFIHFWALITFKNFGICIAEVDSFPRGLLL
jgi:hypothetical protein